MPWRSRNMPAKRDWEETPVQTQGSTQGPHTNVLFAKNDSSARQGGGRQGRGRWKGIPSWLPMDCAWSCPWSPRDSLQSVCRWNAELLKRNLAVQLGVNAACAPAASRWPPHAAPFCRATICCSFNEWISLGLFFFFFQQNNSFSGVICIPMDGLSPLLTLLCVCMGCACWGRVVREKRWCASESSRWGGGGCCWEGHASGLLLIAMFNRLFLWRLGQLAAALFPLHVLSAACFLAWTRKGGFTSFRNAHEVQVYGIKYWSRFFFIKKKKTWHSLGLMNLCPPCLGRCLWICVAVLHAVCGRKPAAPVNIAVPCGAH